MDGEETLKKRDKKNKGLMKKTNGYIFVPRAGGF